MFSIDEKDLTVEITCNCQNYRLTSLKWILRIALSYSIVDYPETATVYTPTMTLYNKMRQPRIPVIELRTI